MGMSYVVCVSKVQSLRSYRGQLDGTRGHKSTLEYLKTRLGLDGLLCPLFVSAMAVGKVRTRETCYEH